MTTQPMPPADYESFLYRKLHDGANHGFDPIALPESLFEFQQFLVTWALRRGRAAILADTGLGKTLMELAWADNVVRKTNRPVLLLTPLAVAPQTVREAEKFGIQACHAARGIAGTMINVVNYERLHLFDSRDFAGVVCDECFAKGTQIDTLNGKEYIENIRQGTYIVNAAGIDRVSDVHRREVQYAVRITTNVSNFIASPNHPIFTQRGWVGAQHLRPGDHVLESGAAVHLVRDGICPEISGSERPEILRDILLSEMADDTTGDISCGSLVRGCGETRSEKISMVQDASRSQGTGADTRTESDGKPGNEEEGEPNIESDEPRSFRAWGKWQGTNETAVDSDGCIGKGMDSGICFVVGPTSSRLADALQTRLRKSAEENRHRGGWSIASQPHESGREERCNPGWLRVDGAEILEQGHPDLERLRDADGKLYFYDLGATRHPSYSVNGLLVHNSSILKSYMGATRQEITRFINKVPYRLLATATAAPNDWVELGTSSEALGELSHSDMLRRFFAQLDDKGQKRERAKQTEAERIIADDPSYYLKLAFRVSQSIGQWRLKHHAVGHFWRWVASWARACRLPSDLGFDDTGYLLPPLIEKDHLIAVEGTRPGYLFNMPAIGLGEEREERKRTLKQRCEYAADLVNHDRPAVVWCQMNAEGDLLEQLIPDARQIAGSTPEARKLELYEAFTNGDLRVLVIKPKIGAWGLNWQHCSHVVTFATHSYEQYYQSVRRCWRFGQQRPVQLDVIATEGEERVLTNMRHKGHKADLMFQRMIAEMNNSLTIAIPNLHTKTAELPAWL